MRATLVALTATAVALTTVTATALPAAADGTTITVDVSSPRQVDHQLTVSGTVTSAGQPVAAATVSGSRTDPDGSTASLGVQTTDSEGHYAFSDTPDQRGTVTYQVSWMGDPSNPSGATGTAQVQIAGLPTSLTLSVDDHVVRFGHRVRLTAHLQSGTTSRHVAVYAKPYRRDRRQVAAGDVDSTSGDLSTAYRIGRRTRFTAHFAGDARYAPASDHALVRARGLIREQLHGGYANRGGYRLYRVGTRPRLVASLRPRLDGVCLRFRAQRYGSGGWERAAVSGCLHTNASGDTAGWFKYGRAGERYRLRAQWAGNRTALGCHGHWVKVKFHR